MKNRLFEAVLWLRNAIGRILPHQVVYGIGVVLGYLLSFLLGSRRKVARENLKMALNLDAQDAERMTKRVFRSLGLTVAEILLVPYITDRFIEQCVEIEGEEYLRAAMEEERGVIVFTGHFGNWELLGGIVAKLGYPVNAVARQQNSAVGDKFLARVREQYGEKISIRGMGLREGYRALRRGELLALLGDQDAGDHGWFVEFFGRQASTFPGPVQLAQRTGAPIVPIFHVRTGVSRHKVIIRPPVHIPCDASPEDLHRYLQDLTGILEELVRKYPDQWFWIHRRWKSQPREKEKSPNGSSTDL